jgi:hypothetical protein
MKTASLNIKKMSLLELHNAKAKYNPREIGHEEREGLKFSMDKFGYVQNIIFNELTGNVVSGHQRIDILRSEGFEEADVNVVNIKENDEKKLNIIMNSSTIQGDFTKELNDILDGIMTDDPEFFDMTSLSLLYQDGIELEELKEDEKNDEIVKGMELLPYESYDCLLVICKRRDDFMFLSSKLNLTEKVVISSSMVKNKKLGETRCVSGERFIELFTKDASDEYDL